MQNNNSALKKVLHIVDDEKFQDYIKVTFDLPELENRLISSALLCEYGQNKVEEFDHIIIHYLNKSKAKWLLSVNPNHIIWFIWGSDIHNLAKFRNEVYLPETAKLMDQFRHPLKRTLFYKKINFKIFPSFYDAIYNNDKIKAFKKIDVAIPVLPSDYNLLQENYKIDFPAFYLNYMVPNLDKIKTHNLNGENLLFGNSAHPSNNHKEALRYIENANLNIERRIIFPLNYGNTRYRDIIIALIKDSKINSDIYTEMIPLPEYINLLSSCNVMIFNNLRQQAIGTILHGLILGSHIYLNENSPQYDFLIKNGFIVSKLNCKSKFEGLSHKEQTLNRLKIDEIYGEESNKVKIRQLLKM